MAGIIIFLILIVLVAVMFILSIRQVRQSTARNVERLGKYNRTMGSGIHFIIPFIEKVFFIACINREIYNCFLCFLRFNCCR